MAVHRPRLRVRHRWQTVRLRVGTGGELWTLDPGLGLGCGYILGCGPVIPPAVPVTNLTETWGDRISTGAGS